MKKIFSLMIALVAAMAINAGTGLYIGGINGQWPEPGSNPAYEFGIDEANNCYSISFERIDAGSEMKMFIGEGWGNEEYGAAADGDAITPNEGSYQLVNENAKNLKINIAEKHYLKNATIRVTEEAVVTVICEEIVDESDKADTYQIVGVGGNWELAEAYQFEAVDGVLTVIVPELKGTFKIVQNRKWDNQWATNWDTKAGLALGVPYVLGAKGENGEPSNLALANPFGSYKNAKLTLDITEEVYTLTLVEGTFELAVADWYFPGTKLGWNCNDDTKFEDKGNGVYQFLASEISGDFKIVYGNWMVEFGSAKGEGETWAFNEEISLSTPCDNLYPADKEATYTDVYVTIYVDYEDVEVILLISDADPLESVENTTISEKAIKRVMDGQIVIEKNGVRYNALGVAL